MQLDRYDLPIMRSFYAPRANDLHMHTEILFTCKEIWNIRGAMSWLRHVMRLLCCTVLLNLHNAHDERILSQKNRWLELKMCMFTHVCSSSFNNSWKQIDWSIV